MGVSDAFDEVMAELEKDEQTAPETETATPPESPPAEPTAPSPDTAPATPPAEPAAPETTLGEIKIDAMGRMHRADGTVMSKAEQAAEEARRAAQTPADATATPPTPETPAIPVPPAPRPYKSNVYGEEKEVFPGALIADGHGVFIPEAQRGRFDQLTARGLQYDALRDEVRTAKQQLATGQERFSAVTGAINTTLGQHFASPEALEALAESVLTQGAQSVFDRISLAIERESLAIDRKFGAANIAPAGTPDASPSDDPGNSIPALDQRDAQDAFEEYWTEITAKPELHGMPSELQAQLRTALTETNLFTFDRQQGWCINEIKAAPVLAMAVETMKRLKTTAAATAFNAKQTTPASAIPAPPSVVTAKAPVGKGSVSPAKKPVESTGDPWEDAMAESSRLIRAG